jgi:hypothetical protein
MDMLKTVKPSTSMPVYKPYKLNNQDPPTPHQEKPLHQTGLGEIIMEALNENNPSPQNMLIPPPSAILPFPPPNMLYLYQIVPVPTKTRASSLPSSPPSPGPPLQGLPVPVQMPMSKTKPRTVHEYYDQHSFQWREFNPEDTVIGDETDPFIVYFRYANKSIGARRTAWILPKHIKLIKIMQDCLPDFDWRTGEDLLVWYSLMRANDRLKRECCICDERI